jgi:hypothetical protein
MLAEELKRLAPMSDMSLNYHLMHPGGDSGPGDPNAAFYLVLSELSAPVEIRST